MSHKEFSNKFLNTRVNSKDKHKKVPRQLNNFENVPDKIDWRDFNVVTPVKNQGQCVSAAIFAGVGVIESLNAIYNGKLTELSETNVEDCTDHHCNGGFVEDTYNYVLNNGGIDTQIGYPGNGNGTCLYDPKFKGASIDGWIIASNTSETYLQTKVGLYFPVSVGYDASSETSNFTLVVFILTMNVQQIT